MAILIDDFNNKIENIDLNFVFLFPGSGVEISGHERKFFDSNKDFCRPFFEICLSKTGLNIEQCFFSDKENVCNDLEMQFFTYTFSAIIASWLSKKGIKPKLTGGYSMGLYCAAYASGFVSFEAGLELINIAFKTMDNSLGKKKGGLLAVVGLTADELNSLVDITVWPSISISVVSSEASLVFSGSNQDLEAFAIECEKKGAYKVLFLKVDFPYHNSKLLSNVPSKFLEEINDIEFRSANTPIYSTFTYQKIESGDKLRNEMAEHLATPISWLKLLEEIHSTDYDIACECGPGLSLTQISRFVPDRIKYWNVRNIENRIRKL